MAYVKDEPGDLDAGSVDSPSLRIGFVQLARDAGALSGLPLALATRSAVHLFAGESAIASSLLEEVVAVNEATGASLARYVGLAHVTFRGREAEVTPLIEAATKELVRRGDGQGLRFIHWATAVLYNGLARYDDAIAELRRRGRPDGRRPHR